MISGSLFSGIGGFDLALVRAGFTPAWLCEINNNCKNILNRRFGGVKIYEDIKDIDETAQPVDIVVGGFPCQDLSVAGKRAGLNGERSGLWFEFERVLGILKPEWVVIENVPGLLTSNKGRDFAIVLQGLAQLGYGVCWRVLDSQYWGVAQRRRRVFIVGHLGDGRASQVLFEPESKGWDTAPCRKEREDAPTATLRGFGHGWQGQHNDTNAVIAVRPAQTGANGKGFLEDGTVHTLDSTGGDCVAYSPFSHYGWEEADHAATLQDRENRVSGSMHLITCDMDKSYWDGGQIADTLDSSMLGKGQMMPEKRRFPVVLTGAYNTNEGGSAGVRIQVNAEKSVTLQSGGGGMSAKTGMYTTKRGIRRLTPTECERLQGFPDGWTEGQSDTTRYRQLGNAVTVNVVEWIVRRIANAK